jgi:uncharacterized damage-inducible protein DinB
LTSVSGSLQEHLNRLGRMRERLLQEFSKMTAEDFWKIMQLTDYDVSPAYVVHHLMQHEAEHRSQIDAIRRKAKIVMSDRLPEENS